MVLSLGYHRLSTMQSDTDYARQVKISLFWMVYWFDTSFSVRLGHAPVIRDYDITVPRLSSCSSIMPSAFLVAFNYSTTLSGLQCQVVEQLYSPLALRQSVDERHTRASRLMVALEEALNERQLVGGRCNLRNSLRLTLNARPHLPSHRNLSLVGFKCSSKNQTPSCTTAQRMSTIRDRSADNLLTLDASAPLSSTPRCPLRPPTLLRSDLLGELSD